MKVTFSNVVPNQPIPEGLISTCQGCLAEYHTEKGDLGTLIIDEVYLTKRWTIKCQACGKGVDFVEKR